MDNLIEGAPVHYVDADGKNRAAVITDILRTEKGKYLDKATCQLTVFFPGYEAHTTADHDAESKPGTWHWIGEKPKASKKESGETAG